MVNTEAMTGPQGRDQYQVLIPPMRVFTFLIFLLAFTTHSGYACDAPSNSFCVDYFANRTLTGPATFSTTEPAINHSWQNTSPSPSVPIYNFSARWRGVYNFSGGDFIFRVVADDGVRLIIDGKVAIDAWISQSSTEYKATVTLTPGTHLVEIEYYQAWGWASLVAAWEPVRACDVPVGQFCSAYYDNKTLSGNPKVIAYESSINHQWGSNANLPQVPAYNFSARWQGDFDFAEGTYSFTTIVDDGIRLWVDDRLVIDYAWLDQSPTFYEEWLWLSGRHRVTVEYYQAYGSATLQVGWNLVAPAQAVKPDPIGSNALSPLGTNLSDWRDWSTEQPFIDLFKTSRSWITQAPGVWDTGEQKSLDLDANGWVRSLPDPGNTKLRYRSVSTILLGGGDLVGIRPGGQYIVLYDGEGTLNYSIGATKIAAHSTPGRDVISVDKNNSTGIVITIASTDPKRSGNYLRNIRVVSPGYVCDDDPLAFCYTSKDPACNRSACRSVEQALSSRLFHPQFLKNLVHYRALRFMSPQSTNVISSTLPQQVNWVGRSKLDMARWSSQAGIPVEVAVTLSNQLKSNPWLNMPHQASDDYIRQFARLVRSSLDPNLKVYVEYANEVWNTSFSAGNWVERQGLLAWPNARYDSPYTKRINWYGKRTAETCDIWKSEWKGQEDRVICVLSAQAANSWTARAALACQLWDKGPCQSHGITALAIAPYFGHYLGDISTWDEVASWTTDTDGGLGRLFAELGTGGQLTEGPAGGSLALSAQWVAGYANLAKTKGLTLLAYEGGQHLVGIGTVQNDESVNNLFITANRDPRMGDLYLQSLRNWRDSGGNLFMNYSSVGQYGRYGSWGALENMLQTSSPKYDALLQFIVENQK